MSNSNSTKKNSNSAELIQWVPQLMAGASLGVSLYTLYKLIGMSNNSNNNNNNNNSNSSKIIKNVESAQFIIPDSDSNHAVLSRVMLPDDANPGGNVHGGTTLKMIGHAGWLAANRYLQTHTSNNNKNNDEMKGEEEEVTNVAVIVRMEGMTFREPIFIGEVATVDATVTYTAHHSCEVQVNVYAENIRKGSKRITNTARLWFVSMSVPTRHGLHNILRNRQKKKWTNSVKLIKMPQLEHYPMNGKLCENEGKLRYFEQKKRRKQESQFSKLMENFELTEWVDRSLAAREYDQNRPAPTVSILSQVSLPSDCFSGDIIDGGTIMKMMDNCAGSVAARWCQTSVVTIAIDSINFLTSIHSGEIIHTYGRLVYTSKRSIEILVLTFRESRNTLHTKSNNNNNNNDESSSSSSPQSEQHKRNSLSQSKNPGIYDRFELACTAFFTFVSITRNKETNKPQATEVSQFIPVTSIEKALYDEGKARYIARKNAKMNNNNNNNNSKKRNSKTTIETKDESENLNPTTTTTTVTNNNNNNDINSEDSSVSQKYRPTVVVGPSGVGKGTLLEILMKKHPNIFSKAVSHTTRESRKGEINGIHYYFINRNEFENGIKNNEFIEYADVHGNYYGTSKKSLYNVAKNNQICLLEIDYQGAINIKKLSKYYDGKKFGEIENNGNNNEYIEANFMFITCKGGLDTLKERLKNRNTENESKIEKRLKTAEKEFEFFENNKDFFDFVLINDDLDRAANQLCDKFEEWYPWLKAKQT